MECVTQGIVLNTKDSGESDILATLLTPSEGKLFVVFRGVKKPNAKLKAYAQSFCFGEFCLTKSKRCIVTSVSAVEFFEETARRQDSFRAASLVLETAELATEFDAACPEIFIAVLRALKDLNYSDKHATIVIAMFLNQLLNVLGYRQSYSSCIACGKVPEAAYYRAAAGGVFCWDCRQGILLADSTYADIVGFGQLLDGIDSHVFAAPQKIVRLLGMGLEEIFEKKLTTLKSYS